MPLLCRLLAFALLLSAPAAAADGDRPGTLNLAIENDRVANTDRHYTHGSYASYVTGKGEVPDWARPATRRLPLLAGPVDRLGVVLGQTMFTPDDIAAARLIEDDRPYAGYLYTGVQAYAEQLGGAARHGAQLDGLQLWELDLGLVGPASEADDVQTMVHELIDAQRPNGWDHQLANEPVANLYYTRYWRFLAALDDDGHQAALIPQAEAALGNAYTYAAAGLSFALGRNLRANWGAARIRPNVRAAGFSDPRRGGAGEDWHWSAFVGVQGRAVARNVFLDGNAFDDSHSVDKKPLVGELQAGITLAWRRYQLAFTQVLRTREFERQPEADIFGAVTLSVTF